MPPYAYVVIGGIDCAVADQSESWPESGPQATIRLKMPWPARYTVAQNLLGTATMNGGAVVRVPPFAYPRSSITNMRCVSLGDIEPVGSPIQTSSDGMFDYDYAFITANFGVLRYQIDAGDPSAGHRDPSGLPYTQTRVRTNAELFSPPGKNYFTIYDQKPVPESAVAMIMPNAEISMTRLMLPYVPVYESMGFLQTVNSATVRIGNFDFLRGTLMYGGMEIQDAADPLGRLLFTVTYTLLGKYDVEWNEVFKESDWRMINTKADNTGNPPFRYIAFDNPTLPGLLSGFPA